MIDTKRKYTTAERIAEIREKIDNELNEAPFIVPKPGPSSPVPTSPKNPKPDDQDEDETDEIPVDDQDEDETDEIDEIPPELPPHSPGLPIPPEYVKPRPKT